MAVVNKIDSNITGLAYAEEAALGYLPGEGSYPGTPIWHRLQPISYADFGGEVVTVAPNPINPSRQRRKGRPTDLNASGGFNHYLTYQNMQDLFQGFMFADIRRKGRVIVTAVDAAAVPDSYMVDDTTGFMIGSIIKGKNFNNAANNALNVVSAVAVGASVSVPDGLLTTEAGPPDNARIDVVGYQADAGDLDVVTTGNYATITATTLDFTTLRLVPGQWIFVGGDTDGTQFDNPANNGFKRIRSIAPTALVIDKSDQAMVAETNPDTIRIFFGDVLRNETGTLVKRRSYNLERTLGAPDTDAPTDVQSEVLIGAVPNELTINIPQADLLNLDMSFVANDNLQRDAATGPKQANVVSQEAALEYNTSSDVGRIRLTIMSADNEAPTPLFGFVTEGTLTINNNVTPNKAVGVFGAFDATAGTFAVSGNITAYFSTIAAVQAVRNNNDVTLDISFVNQNTGIVFDMPLISLGDGRLNVEIDQAVTIPLRTDAASGEDLDTDLNHTLLITYFNYLPNIA